MGAVQREEGKAQSVLQAREEGMECSAEKDRRERSRTGGREGGRQANPERRVQVSKEGWGGWRDGGAQCCFPAEVGDKVEMWEDALKSKCCWVEQTGCNQHTCSSEHGMAQSPKDAWNPLPPHFGRSPAPTSGTVVWPEKHTMLMAQCSLCALLLGAEP